MKAFPFLVAIPCALFGALVSWTVVGQAQAGKTPSAVAYVSPSRILNESSHGRAEGARLQRAQQQRTTELRTKQQALETTRQQLAGAADGPAKIELIQKEQQQRTDLERATQQAQLDLQNMQREMNTDLQQRVRMALTDLLKTQPYQLVINSDTTVLWSAPELDLTAAVVGRMNGQ